MRLVLDTNVIVSALIWGGTPYKLLQAATDGDIELFTSPVLLAELRGVLAREHLASRLVKQRSSVEQAIGFYGELAISVSPLTAPRAVPRDVNRTRDRTVTGALARSPILRVQAPTTVSLAPRRSL